MSHQPSTTEQLIEKSKTAYNTIAHTIAPSTQTESTHEVKKRDLAKDDQGQACKKDSYQDQLNKAARGPTTMEQEEKTIIEKGLSTLRQTSSGEEAPESDSASTSNDGVKRPDHDVQVEEFLRNQYMSKKEITRVDGK